MSNYTGVNYEQVVDCFAKTAHIDTELRFGDVDAIKEPLFTILIPTYDRVDLLEDALNSAINQWHVSFPWDIVVLDNEADNGKPNKTEKLIRKLDHPRVLYYRNKAHMRPGDNFNRGFLLARGKWVMMLHDDDLLIPNSLQNMGRVVKFLTKHCKKPLGAVSTLYHQFTYDKKHPKAHWGGIAATQNYFLSQPTSFALYKLSHSNIFFTGHIGGDVPSNGATYLREAVLETGGFNEDFGISADLILYYCMENRYSVYSTTIPYGFYRWGDNTMSKFESTYNTIKNNFDFRNYVYSKNIFSKIWGKIFGTSQYRRFAVQVIQQRKQSVSEPLSLDDFDSICAERPNKHLYAIYALLVKELYDWYKGGQVARLYKKSLKDKEIWE